LFEILRIDRENLPAGHLLAQPILTQYLDGSHVGKLQSQAGVMFFRGGEPNAIV
jgi:hypothetical protein